jgi:hypothetical protein
MSNFNKEHIKDMFANPFYAIVFANYLFGEHELKVSKQKWVDANADLLERLGPRIWLERLLRVLSSEPSDDPQDNKINPYWAVVFSDRLKGDHPPLVETDKWVQVSINLIKETGTGDWLWRLLKVVETGGV